MAAGTRVQRPKRSAKRQLLRKRAVARTSARRPAPRSDVVEAALAAFAHEVRTPLTGILAISDLLATSDLGERERRWADTIKAGAEHLANLATLFVDAAKAGRRASLLRHDLFDLRALARHGGDSLAGRAAAKGLKWEVAVSPKLPALVVGDPVRLRAALENLIDNAVKFTERGGVAFSAAPARAPKGRVGVTFAISDSGIGLTVAEIKRLFRPFSQANASIAARFGGSGLGLHSVKQLARAMGGDIAVTPRRGGGATFSLTVCLEQAEAEACAASRQGGEAIAGGPAGLRLLSVEDNPFGRVVLNTILAELGHQADFVGRGEDALERLPKGGFEAVLMDMVLPGISGIDAIRGIRKLKVAAGRVPIIGISGRGEDEAAARQAGADAFLLKPVSPRALATALLEATRHAAAAT